MFSLKIKNPTEGILQYLFAFVVILYGQSILMRIEWVPGFVENRNIILSTAATIILALLIIYKRRLFKNSIIIAMILAILFIGHILIKGYGSHYIYYVLIPLVLMVIYLRVLWEEDAIGLLIKKYADIIIIIAVLSLIMYFLGTVLHILPSTSVTYFWNQQYKTSDTYFYLQWETQTQTLFGTTLVRNCGIYAEAPSYAVSLSIALFYETFVAGKINKIRVGILLLTIITTFSTKAYLMVCVMVALKMIQFAYVTRKKNVNTNIIRLIVPFLLLLVIIACLFIIDVKATNDDWSFSQRMDNIQSTISAFLDHPLFGVGIGNEDAVSQYSLLSLSIYGFSMGATLLLAEGGIYLTLFYLGAFIHAMRNTDNKWMTFCVFIMYLALLFQSNINFFLSTTFIVALGYSMPNMKKQKKRLIDESIQQEPIQQEPVES